MSLQFPERIPGGWRVVDDDSGDSAGGNIRKQWRFTGWGPVALGCAWAFFLRNLLRPEDPR